MKKLNYLILACAAICGSIYELQAQVEIEKNDLPAPSSTYVYKKFLSPGLSNIDLSKQAFALNSSALNDPTPDSVSIYPVLNHWSKAEFAIRHHDATGTISVQYVKNEGSNLNVVGLESSFFGNGDYQHFPIDKPFVGYHSPMALNNQFQTEYSSIDTILNPSPFPAVDTLVAHIHSMTTRTVDGYGTVILPNGKTLEALRVFEEKTDTDTADVYIPGPSWVKNAQNQLVKRYTYWYFSPGYGYPIAYVKMDQNNQLPRSISFLEGAQLSAMGSITTPSNILLFPNPSNGLIKIHNNSGHNIQTLNLLDVNGRSIRTIQNPLNSVINLNLSQGVYIVQLKTDQGNSYYQRLRIN